jgi:hypothetical protein
MVYASTLITEPRAQLKTFPFGMFPVFQIRNPGLNLKEEFIIGTFGTSQVLRHT